MASIGSKPRSDSPIDGESDPVTVRCRDEAAIYLETTIPSYLTAWPSRDLVRAAHQQITREWWVRRQEYELFVSQLVIRECQAGDREAAEERLEALDGIPLLEQVEEAESLAQALLDRVPLPGRATADALHIATAACMGWIIC